jgi:ABC-type multidrug transport system ATPase subunit
LFDTGNLDEDEESFVDWAMEQEIKEMKARNIAQKSKRLGVTWRNLTVKGVGRSAMVQENVLSQFNFLQGFRDSRQPKNLKTVLNNSHGCVKPGEMLLVVGRPGSGCTTLLRQLASKRSGYADIEGDVHFGSLPPEEPSKYRGQIVMNTEREILPDFDRWSDHRLCYKDEDPRQSRTRSAE